MPPELQLKQPKPMSERHSLSAPFELPLTPPNSTPGSSPEQSQARTASYAPTHDTGATDSSTNSRPINIVKTSTKVVNGFTISLKEPCPLETPPSTPGTASDVKLLDDETDPAFLFLKDVFPGRGAKEALPHAKSVTIEQEDAAWEGAVLALPGQDKTLYVNGRGAESVQLRESIVALLDLAGEHLDCAAFVIALDKTSSSLAGLIHSLLYVSGTVVTKPPFEVDESKYVLVGIEI